MAGLTVDENNSAYYSVNNCLIRKADKTLLGTNRDHLIPADGSVTSIGHGTFEDIYMEGIIIIPEGIVSIGDNAFMSCFMVREVHLPASLTYIGMAAFESTALTDIYYSGTEAEWNAIGIYPHYNGTLSNATIHFLSEEGTAA